MQKLTVVACCFLLLMSCSSATRQDQTDNENTTKVKVENDNKLDMTVYVLLGSQRIRLGMVPSYTSRVFTIPDNVIARATSIRLLADPIGQQGTPVSEEFSVLRGQTIEMVITNF